ncbi:uncharacterized protein FIBRA_07891 [Fibroporia radiculosa]|uniref:Uncharacterized protein n=1 Tax=Fibroporia radiculosa TaxID=599839 RepID=J4IC23_9APHY|nr:uncharacterized protein FIBRA_07891 [Fibroporia radiculosa]CCM05661.1 predicted protein [Fibroporia radiculosa]
MRVPSKPIPKSPDRSSLRKRMHITESKFRELTACLRTLADQHLDVRLTYATQNPTAKRKLQDEANLEACARHPFLRKYYEGAWPIDQFLDRYVRARRHWIKKSTGIRHGHRVPPTNLNQSQKKVPAFDHAQTYQAQTDDRQIEVTVEPIAALDEVTSASSLCPSSTWPEVAVETAAASESNTGSFLQFIQRSSPKLEKYITAFGQVGIDSKAGIHMLLGWPEEYCIDLVRKDMGLTPSQADDVCQALDELTL